MPEVSDIFGNLTQKQLAAVECLLSCKTQAETAKSVSVDPETIRRWMHDPEFTGYLAQCRKGLLLGTISALAGSSIEAVATLVDLMRTSADERVKVACAKQLLSFAPQYDEHYVMAADIEQIKANLEGKS